MRPASFLRVPSTWSLDLSRKVLCDAAGRCSEILAPIAEQIRAGCWAHARRKLKDALDTDAKEKAVPLLRLVQRLFWIERAVGLRIKEAKLEPDPGRELWAEVRRRRSRRILGQIDEIVRNLRCRRSTLPKSAFGKALTYIYNQWEPLTRFLDNPALPIHNNDSERALRHVVLGRKNWLFFGSPRGAAVGANLFSLIATCKALKVNAERYIEDVLQKVDTTPASKIARLTPWAWAEEQKAATS